MSQAISNKSIKSLHSVARTLRSKVAPLMTLCPDQRCLTEKVSGKALVNMLKPYGKKKLILTIGCNSAAKKRGPDAHCVRAVKPGVRSSGYVRNSRS